MGGKKTTGGTRAYRYFTAFLVLALTTLVVVYGCSVLQASDGGDSSLPDPSVDVTSAGTSTDPEGETSGDLGTSDPAGTSSSDASTEPAPKEDTVVSVLACGDNLIHPSVYYYAMECYASAHSENCTYAATNEANYDFSSIYENVAARMKGADICYINQETLSGGAGTRIDGYPMFNSPEAVGRTIRELGVDVVNMAHNHMLDAGNDSFLIHSDAYFSSLGMTPLGYYENEADTNNIVLYEEQGITFAFLTYTYGTNGNVSRSETYIPYIRSTEAGDVAFVRRQVALAKQQADVVIVSAHWGWEDAFNPNDEQRYFANLFCELGVDVVIGMHSHCIQPMQWMEGANGHRMLLTYSLGNFVSGMQGGLNVLEGMLSFNVRQNAVTGEITIEEPLFTPLVLHYTKESPVDGKDTGYRNFKLYDLKDYTAELAAAHGVVWYERSHGTTLHGGGFNLDNLYQTLRDIIPAEFLPEEYK